MTNDNALYRMRLFTFRVVRLNGFPMNVIIYLSRNHHVIMGAVWWLGKTFFFQVAGFLVIAVDFSNTNFEWQGKGFACTPHLLLGNSNQEVSCKR